MKWAIYPPPGEIEWNYPLSINDDWVNGWFSRSYCIDQKGGESIEYFRETFVITKIDVAADAVNIKMLAVCRPLHQPFLFYNSKW